MLLLCDKCLSNLTDANLFWRFPLKTYGHSLHPCFIFSTFINNIVANSFGVVAVNRFLKKNRFQSYERNSIDDQRIGYRWLNKCLVPSRHIQLVCLTNSIVQNAMPEPSNWINIMTKTFVEHVRVYLHKLWT